MAWAVSPKWRVGRSCLVAALLVSVAACTTPKVLSQQDLVNAGQAQLKEFESRRQQIGDGVSLSEAMAWAMERNLTLRAESLERALSVQNRKLATAAMLPNLTAQAGYRWRNNQSASSSENVISGGQSLVPSTSSERTGVTASLEASWNVLDFGLAWIRARIEGDKVWMAEESRRRMAHQLAMEVASAWERAAAFQRVAPQLQEIRTEVNESLKKLDRLAASGLSDPVSTLDHRSALLLILKRMDALSLQMDQSQDELARLLGLPAGSALRLDAQSSPLSADFPKADVRVWQSLALLNRPEIRLSIYAQRNAQRGVHQRVLEQFPSLLLKFGANYDSNKYLVNNSWEDASVSLSMGLMRLATLPLHYKRAKIEREKEDIKAELQATAVLSQVAIAHKALQSGSKQACLGTAIRETSARRLKLLEARYKAASLDELNVLRARADDLLLDVEKSIMELDEHRALFMLAQSVGVGVWPEQLSDNAQERERQIAAWLAGGMNQSVAQALQQVQKDFGLPADKTDQGQPDVPEKGLCE